MDDCTFRTEIKGGEYFLIIDRINAPIDQIWSMCRKLIRIKYGVDTTCNFYPEGKEIRCRFYPNYAHNDNDAGVQKVDDLFRDTFDKQMRIFVFAIECVFQNRNLPVCKEKIERLILRFLYSKRVITTGDILSMNERTEHIPKRIIQQ